MPRTARVTFPKAFHHILNRGAGGQKIFLGTRDYQRFLKKLEELGRRFDYFVYAYVLMPTHFHFLLQVRKVPVGKIMSCLQTSHAVYFSKKYGRSGPLFQNRFKSLVCDKDNYFLELSRYILLNPVRAGMVERLEDYPWSSYQELFGHSSFQIIDKDEIKRLIGEGKKAWQAYYQSISQNPKELMLKENEIKTALNKGRELVGSSYFVVRKQKQFLKTR
jgi:putative transposase